MECNWPVCAKAIWCSRKILNRLSCGILDDKNPRRISDNTDSVCEIQWEQGHYQEPRLKTIHMVFWPPKYGFILYMSPSI